MRACFIKNKYYSDSGMEYIFNRLYDEFFKFGITLEVPRIFAEYPSALNVNYDFAIIWDKDVRVVKFLENHGIRCFNCSCAIEACDDKEKTFAELAQANFNGIVPLPKTIASPLIYDVNSEIDEEFLKDCELELSYPIVVKENFGSAGRQVYLANNYQQLFSLHKQLLHIPHIFQEFLKGEYGSDIRIYMVGGEPIIAVKRTNTTDFRSNVSVGGQMNIIELPQNVLDIAVIAARKLKLDYGSVDFILSDTKPYIIEVNSNAYFKTVESLGANIAQKFAKYVMEAMGIDRRN